jgi:ribosomal protein S18 acetylase RimI-like enzyme
MLRDEARYFSTRYEDVVREPESTWRDWVIGGARGKDKVLFVAEDGDVVMGVVGGFGRLDRAEVQLISLWVDPHSRGHGAARALIRAVAQWARERSAERVVLFVQESNAPGRALYASAGFLPTGDRAPVGEGRPGFKLVLSAAVDDLLA